MSLVDVTPDPGAFLADIRTLVEVESSSADIPGCGRAVQVAGELILKHLGRTPEVREADGRPHLYLPAAGGRAKALILGHVDTVWPMGTLARWPLTIQGDVVSGPGIFDMKAGVVMALHALSALGAPDSVSVLLTTDEELGSVSSEELIIEAGRAAEAVLVLEAAAPGGALKKARKGVASYEAVITGRAAHAGLEPEKGINALMELAALVPQVAAIARPAIGTTVTPTLASAGTTMNTVPAQARFRIDLRAETKAEMERVEAELGALVPTVPGAEVKIVTHATRAPLEEVMSADLLARMEAVSAALGDTLPPAVKVGGGSDGNFTASVGIPTLDGLGAVGDGAHAEGEHMLLGATLQATRRLTALLADLLS